MADSAVDCRKAGTLLNAYLDGELDLSASLELEAHLADCAACRAERETLSRLSRRLREGLTRHEAPAELRQRLARLTAVPRPAAPGRWQRRQFLAMAASVLLAVFASGGTTYLLMRPVPLDPLADEVVGSHIRSLMGDHLIDIASSDQHTVKPWFDGRLDLAPAVADLKAEGFPLVGGRLDYIDHQPVAAIVYQRGKHLINLFAWPTNGPAHAGVRAMTIRGYNLLTWAAGDLTYWAVSDVNPKDLATLQRLIAQSTGATPD